jgi:hypothetical protein
MNQNQREMSAREYDCFTEANIKKCYFTAEQLYEQFKASGKDEQMAGELNAIARKLSNILARYQNGEQ